MRRVRIKKLSSKIACKQETELYKILVQSALPLTLITALLYLFGRVYYETYLSVWGLSESLFPLSKDQSIIAGFWRALLYCLTILTAKWFVVILWGFTLAVLISMYRPLVERLQRLPLWLQRKNIPFIQNNVVATAAHGKIMFAILTFSVVAGVVILVAALVAFPCQWISNEAKKDARRIHQDILDGKSEAKRFSSQVTLTIKTEPQAFDVYSGHLIQMSATHVALYDRAKGMLIFPLANVARIEIPENKTEVKKGE